MSRLPTRRVGRNSGRNTRQFSNAGSREEIGMEEDKAAPTKLVRDLGKLMLPAGSYLVMEGGLHGDLTRADHRDWRGWVCKAKRHSQYVSND